MARIGEIAEFNPSDGFTPWQTRKLNTNFGNIAKKISNGSLVEVHSVETLDPGLPAYVKDVGYPPIASLAFGIPKGEKGDRHVFFGISESGPTDQVKLVSADDFTSEFLIDGTILFVLFTAGQAYNGAPSLNVNNTGAVVCHRLNGNEMRYTWQQNEIVAFIYRNGYWQLFEGGFATTTYYGVTKLIDSVTSTSIVNAATPNSVKTAYDLAKKKLNAEWLHDDILWVIENNTVGDVMKKTVVTG